MTTSTSLNFTHSLRDGVLIVELHGAIESAQALDPVTELSLQSSAQHVVVVLTHVDYINSAGFSGLIQLSEQVAQAQKSAFFVGLQSKVHVVFNSLGAADLFNVLPDIDAALERIKA